MTSVGVPKPRGAVRRAGEKPHAIGAEGHAIDRACMALEGENLLTRAGVPQPRGLVRRAGEKPTPSWLKATLLT